jgi:hypothetical protein
VKKQKHSLALSILLFSGLMAGTVLAHADETETDPPSRHTEAPPSSPPNTEADAPISNQAKSNGFIEDAHFKLLFRSYSEHFEMEGAKNKDAWVIGNQAVFESGYTRGLFGVGFDASLFSALKLNGGQGAGNRVHLNADGTGQNQVAWTYPGVWDVKARIRCRSDSSKSPAISSSIMSGSRRATICRIRSTSITTRRMKSR